MKKFDVFIISLVIGLLVSDLFVLGLIILLSYTISNVYSLLMDIIKNNSK